VPDGIAVVEVVAAALATPGSGALLRPVPPSPSRGIVVAGGDVVVVGRLVLVVVVVVVDVVVLSRPASEPVARVVVVLVVAPAVLAGAAAVDSGTASAVEATNTSRALNERIPLPE